MSPKGSRSRVAFIVSVMGGRADTPNGQACCPGGVEDPGIGAIESPRNLGDPANSISTKRGVERPHPNAPGPRTGVGFEGRDEDRRTGWYCQPKETKGCGMVRRGSERSIVPLNQENSPRENPGEERGR